MKGIQILLTAGGGKNFRPSSAPLKTSKFPTPKKTKKMMMENET
jgi:hypothetical protein